MFLLNGSKVIQNLQRQGNVKFSKLRAGMLKAGMFLEAESGRLVPVDYGFLKNSSFTRVTGTTSKTLKFVVGYAAEYAAVVHENEDALHGEAFNVAYAEELAKQPTKGPFRHSRGPKQRSKFLEIPFRRNKKNLIAIIVQEVKK